jgi:AcrR family transcriptional regulator
MAVTQSRREPRVRRTQAQRSATTRAALLDATIACLIDVGYANMTTRLIAERAGVSQGAQQGQFKTKATLVGAAVQELEERIAGALSEPANAAPDEREGAAEFLDQIWEIHSSPLFLALVELLIAARTDPDLATTVDELTIAMTAQIATGARQRLPTTSGHPDFDTWLLCAITSIHGLAMRIFTPRLHTDARWPRLRETLLRALPQTARR